MYDENEYGLESLWSPDMAQYQGTYQIFNTNVPYKTDFFKYMVLLYKAHYQSVMWSCLPGTALYVYNDAVFTTEDWNGIQEIARSRKREDPLKVGRFGIGFNSVYHITGNCAVKLSHTIYLFKYIYI